MLGYDAIFYVLSSWFLNTIFPKEIPFLRKFWSKQCWEWNCESNDKWQSIYEEACLIFLLSIGLYSCKWSLFPKRRKPILDQQVYGCCFEYCKDPVTLQRGENWEGRSHIMMSWFNESGSHMMTQKAGWTKIKQGSCRSPIYLVLKLKLAIPYHLLTEDLIPNQQLQPSLLKTSGVRWFYI